MSARPPALPRSGPAAPAAPAPTKTARPEEETRLQAPWRVVLYDDDVHTFEEVILQVMRATGCTFERAQRHTWTVHTEGKDTVYEGTFEACLRVQGVLREIELVTEIQG